LNYGCHFPPSHSRDTALRGQGGPGSVAAGSVCILARHRRSLDRGAGAAAAKVWLKQWAKSLALALAIGALGTALSRTPTGIAAEEQFGLP